VNWKVAARGARRIVIAVALLLALFTGAGLRSAATSATAPSTASAVPAPVKLIITGDPQTVSEINGVSSTNYILDSQRVTLDGGYDVPLGDGYHDIDLMWTITSEIGCAHSGSAVCQAGVLRYPNTDCALATGQPTPVCGGPGWVYSQPQNDRELKCPVPPKVPASFTHAGQKVTICTSSLLFGNETATGMAYFMGYDVGYEAKSPHHLTAAWGITDPWNPVTGKPVRTYRSTPCKSPGDKWHGDVPPACAEVTASGPFRRVFSKPGYFGVKAKITLPPAGDNDVAPTLYDLPQLRSQAGYAYLEAWLGSGPNAPVREFGLVYHQVGPYAGQYSLYYSPGTTPRVLFPSGGTVTLQMYTDPGSRANAQWPASDPSFPHGSCAHPGGCVILRATENGVVKFFIAVDAKSWAGDKLMFARVTSIAQSVRIPANTNGNYFDDGALFGPVTWSAQLARLSKSGITTPPWAPGDGQSWPDTPSVIRVAGRSGPHGLAGERDAIDLIS
jgi:hypothetical protein